MKPENRQAETNQYRLVAIRPSVYRRLKLYCAQTERAVVDVATPAIDEYLAHLQEQTNA